MDARVARAEAEVKERKQKIDDIVAELKRALSDKLEAGESKQTALDMTADLKKLIETQKAGFVREESEIYGAAFERIRSEVAGLALERGIHLVVRTD